MSKAATLRKRTAYFCQAALAHSIMGVFSLMPVSWASATGSGLARLIGPRLKATRYARTNLALALPGQAQRTEHIIRDMWANIGRTLAEYPHLHELAEKRTELVGQEILDDLKERERPVVFFSGHLANWEIMNAFLTLNGLQMDPVYRPPNNPYVRNMLDRYRSLNGAIDLIPKSEAGTRQLVKSLRAGRNIGILIDQKYNRGLSVPFFGREAMTSTAFIQLAWKYNCPLVPVRIERLTGPNFRLTLYEPIRADIAEGHDAEFQQKAARIHKMLEDWIRERPGQWLWLHRRWPKNQYKE
jgi:KDO2-lipid IV(A) lauroyltransferase